MVKERDIRNVNPWWIHPKNIDKDKHIQSWNETQLKHTPRLMYKLIKDFRTVNTVVYTLRGLRQVGKTTLIKLKIKEFIEKGIAAWNILYYSFDLQEKPRDVVDVIQKYMKITSRSRENKRCYIFLDEITSIPNWQKGIKVLIDNDEIKNCTVVATGSQAIDLKGSAERLPGRRGDIDDSYDKILLPMKFSEYVSDLNPKIKDVIREELCSDDRKIIFNELFNGKMNKKIEKIDVWRNELDDLLKEYIMTGGLPYVVNKKISDGFIPENVYTSYKDSVNGEWVQLNNKEIWLKQLNNAIIKSQGSQTSWNSLAKNTEISSHNTAQDYVRTLENLFVVSIINRYSTSIKKALIKKEKKIYFQDPFLFHMFNNQASNRTSFDQSLEYLEDEGNKGRILEGVIANHLVRWAFISSKRKQSFDPHDHIFYWKDKNNKEVDFIYYDGESIEIPIELKYKNKVYKKELGGMSSFLDYTKKNGLVISKNQIGVQQEYVEIPASVFLVLI